MPCRHGSGPKTSWPTPAPLWDTVRFVRAYLALCSAGFRRQATYRLALVSGLATNLFFGLVRTALFTALYRQRPGAAVGGLGLDDALTYVWMIQAMFGVVWVSWIWEFPEAVRSGDFVVELTRPGDPWLRQLAYELGRTANQLLLRSTLPLLGAAVVLPLALPTTPAGVLALGASMVLAGVVAFEIRYLFGTVAFWSSDYRSVFNIVFPVLWLASGFVIPVDYFPPGLRALADASPLAAMLMAPVHVAIGQSVAAWLAAQAGWAVALGLANRATLALSCRRLVVHGG
jgi:ABC-2 type transport system permease protein